MSPAIATPQGVIEESALPTAEAKRIEAFLRSTPLGANNARFHNVIQVRVLELATRTRPLNGYCGEVSSDANASRRKFFAWQAQPGTTAHLLMDDRPRQRPIYNLYCLNAAGVPVVFDDASDRQARTLPARWSAATWLLFLGSLILGMAASHPLMALYQSRRPQTPATAMRKTPSRPPVHLRADDYR